LKLDNPNPVAVPLLFDLSQLRTIKGTDGRTIQGAWYHDARAGQAASISPTTDPELDEDASGQISGGYPPGTTRRTLVFDQHSLWRDGRRNRLWPTLNPAAFAGRG
jgi:hypothetical protein